VGCWDESDLEIFFLDSFRDQFEGSYDSAAASESDCCIVFNFAYCLCGSAYTSLVCPGQVVAQPSVSICSRRSIALSTSSRMVSSRSSALFLGFSLRGRSFGGFAAGVVGLVSVLGGSDALGGIAWDVAIMPGLIWL